MQCLTLAGGTLAAGACLDAGIPLAFVFVPLVIALVATFGRWNGNPVHEKIGHYGRWFALDVLGLREWSADGSANELPSFLDGFEIREVPLPDWTARLDDAGVGVVVDHDDRTVSATLPVRARRFSLCEQSEQDGLLAGWGDALGAFAGERRLIKRVIWQERASTATAAPASRNAANRSAALASYDELVTNRRRHAVMHECSITVVIDLRRVTGSRSPIDAGIGVLLDELCAFTGRLVEAGFDVDVPLSADEISHAVSVRLDPKPGQHSTARTLAGMIGEEDAKPMPRSALLDWNWVRVGHNVHHTYQVAEWPRLDVHADWMESCVFSNKCPRTITIVAEPVAPSQSRRRVERDATKATTDEAQRTRAGFRVGVEHQRTAVAISEREEELASGFVEFMYAGFVTVTAPDVVQLRTNSTDYEQKAAQCGMGLVSLDACHDVGLVFALPLGRGPASRTLS